MGNSRSGNSRKLRICELAAKLANGRFGSSSNGALSRTVHANDGSAEGRHSGGITIAGGQFSNNGKADIGIVGDVELEIRDTVCSDSPYGIFQESASHAHNGTNMKITSHGNSKIHGKLAGVSVPEGSAAEIELHDASQISGDVYGVEERSATVEQLRAALPAGIPDDVIEDAVSAVRNVKEGTDEEKASAVKQSRIWEWIKEYGADVVGLIVKAASAASN
ncbi:hypothetical protein [Burkholderia territorii]|uniref:hypothetical protein n=1 Tax=Burkholderia territorii TaxID=1503055 RepID=UPI000A7B5920|nr:hypothetical protein [Burkholderia territorii]